MPIYQYQAVDDGCEECEDGFEILQNRGDGRLEFCPECGAPIERLLSSFAIGKSKASALKTLKNAGFTQYNRAGKGEYERVSGDGGPDAIVSGD